MRNPKELYWIASCKRDLMGCPEDVRDSFGYALHLAQTGDKHPDAKPFKGAGGGVLEVVEDYDSDTYRAVYSIKFAEVVFVLHVFKKKSKRGRKTPQPDIDLIKTRLKQAKDVYDRLKKKGEL